MEQELLILFSGVHVAHSFLCFVLYIIICSYDIFVRHFHCLSLDLGLLNIPLVSSNFTFLFRYHKVNGIIFIVQGIIHHILSIDRYWYLRKLSLNYFWPRKYVKGEFGHGTKMLVITDWLCGMIILFTIVVLKKIVQRNTMSNYYALRTLVDAWRMT